jgi:hypothetical protein
MAWTTPVTSWAAGAVVSSTDFNRIEGNDVVLHAGNGQTTLTTISPSVVHVLDIGAIEETFLIGGNDTVSFITTTGRLPGNRIHLIKINSTGTIGYDQSSPPAGSAVIKGNGDGANTLTWYVNRLITLVYSGSAWHHDMKFD